MRVTVVGKNVESKTEKTAMLGEFAVAEDPAVGEPVESAVTGESAAEAGHPRHHIHINIL